MILIIQISKKLDILNKKNKIEDLIHIMIKKQNKLLINILINHSNEIPAFYNDLITKSSYSSNETYPSSLRSVILIHDLTSS